MKTGWDESSLGEVCRFIDYRGKTPQKIDNGLRLITAKNVKMGFLQEEPLEFVSPDIYKSWMTRGIPQKGDVLFTTEAPLGNVAQLDTDERVVFAQRIIVLQPTTTNLDKTFLKYILQTPPVQEEISGKGTGATVQGIKASLLRTIRIPFPELKEQRRIVAILDEAFEGIAVAKANAELNLQNARALFESYLESVFTQRGEGWEEKALGELVTFRNGINFTQSSRGNAVKIVGVKDFQNYFWAPLENLETVITEGKLPASDFLKENDLLFVRSNGNKELIGRCLLAGNVTEEITHSGFTIRARLHGNEVFSRYLCHYLKSQKARRQMIDSGTGTNIKSLSQGTLAELLIPFPSHSEQKRIAQEIEIFKEETRRLESIYRQKIAALDELKKSLLHEAFSGRL